MTIHHVFKMREIILNSVYRIWQKKIFKYWPKQEMNLKTHNWFQMESFPNAKFICCCCFWMKKKSYNKEIYQSDKRAEKNRKKGRRKQNIYRTTKQIELRKEEKKHQFAMYSFGFGLGLCLRVRREEMGKREKKK